MIQEPIIFQAKNGKEFVIKTPKADEAQSYLDMMVLAAQHSPYILPSAEDYKKKSVDGERAVFQECADSSTAIIITAYHEGKMIGFCNGKSNKSFKCKHRAALGIALHPDYRDGGLGMKMMEVLLENMKKFKDIQIIELDVMTNNIAAIKMYEKLGFNKAGLFPRAYILPSGEVCDNLTMYLEV